MRNPSIIQDITFDCVSSTNVDIWVNEQTLNKPSNKGMPSNLKYSAFKVVWACNKGLTTTAKYKPIYHLEALLTFCYATMWLSLMSDNLSLC